MRGQKRPTMKVSPRPYTAHTCTGQQQPKAEIPHESTFLPILSYSHSVQQGFFHQIFHLVLVSGSPVNNLCTKLIL